MSFDKNRKNRARLSFYRFFSTIRVALGRKQLVRARLSRHNTVSVIVLEPLCGMDETYWRFVIFFVFLNLESWNILHSIFGTKNAFLLI